MMQTTLYKLDDKYVYEIDQQAIAVVAEDTT